MYGADGKFRVGTGGYRDWELFILVPHIKGLDGRKDKRSGGDNDQRHS